MAAPTSPLVGPYNIIGRYAYERPQAEEWFADGNATSRATELPLSSTALFSDTSLRNAIHEWEETALQLIMKSDITPLHYKYPHNEAPTFNHATLIGSVTSGMQALAAEKLIHRNLDTRNILVFAFDAADVSKTVVKVSGFGLSVHGHASTHAKPIRYLAPESLQKGSYSEKSDVWSFGVLAWQLLTDGSNPYYMLPEDTAVIVHVLGGGRLEQPSRYECPDERLWEAIESCWLVPKKYRPSFGQLSVLLGQLSPQSAGAGAAAAGAGSATDAVKATRKAAMPPPSPRFAAIATSALPLASFACEKKDAQSTFHVYIPPSPPPASPKNATEVEVLLTPPPSPCDEEEVVDAHTQNIAAVVCADQASIGLMETTGVEPAGSGCAGAAEVVAEKRVDKTDGQSYTKEEFVDLYGRLNEWDISASCENHNAALHRNVVSKPGLGPEPGPGPCPECPYNRDKQSKGSGESNFRSRCSRCRRDKRSISNVATPVKKGKYKDEVRIDATNGRHYTAEEFYDCYNGLAEWEAAGKEWECVGSTAKPCSHLNHCKARRCSKCDQQRQLKKIETTAAIMKKAKTSMQKKQRQQQEQQRLHMPARETAALMTKQTKKKKKKKKNMSTSSSMPATVTGKDIKLLLKSYNWKRLGNSGASHVYELARDGITVKSSINFSQMDSHSKFEMKQKYAEVEQKLELKLALDMNAGANIKCQQSAEQSVENKVWLALA
eukprot:gene8210-426_t